MKKTNELDEREMKLVKLLMADCQTIGDIQAKLKKPFAGTIERMLETEIDKHLGYEKNSIARNSQKSIVVPLWTILHSRSKAYT